MVQGLTAVCWSLCHLHLQVLCSFNKPHIREPSVDSPQFLARIGEGHLNSWHPRRDKTTSEAVYRRGFAWFTVFTRLRYVCAHVGHLQYRKALVKWKLYTWQREPFGHSLGVCSGYELMVEENRMRFV